MAISQNAQDQEVVDELNDWGNGIVEDAEKARRRNSCFLMSNQLEELAILMDEAVGHLEDGDIVEIPRDVMDAWTEVHQLAREARCIDDADEILLSDLKGVINSLVTQRMWGPLFTVVRTPERIANGAARSPRALRCDEGPRATMLDWLDVPGDDEVVGVISRETIRDNIEACAVLESAFWAAREE